MSVSSSLPFIDPPLTARCGGLEPLLLTPVDAAAALGVSRTTLYELMGSSRLAFIRIGKSRRIPVTALREFIEGSLQREGFQL